MLIGATGTQSIPHLYVKILSLALYGIHDTFTHVFVTLLVKFTEQKMLEQFNASIAEIHTESSIIMKTILDNGRLYKYLELDNFNFC